MLTNSYKQQYATQYPSITDNVFLEPYAGAVDLFPTTENIFALFLGGKIPTTQLFQSSPTGYPQLEALSPPNPYYGFGFADTNYLFATPFRAAYVQDMLANPDPIYPTFDETHAITLPQSTSPIRQAFIDNDLRAYRPKSPMVLCGGNQDTSVTYDVNAEALARIWQTSNTMPFALIDLDLSNETERSAMGKTAYISSFPTNTNAIIENSANKRQTLFSADLETLLTAEGDAAYQAKIDKNSAEAVAIAARDAARADTLLTSYHGMLAPYCLSVANDYFEIYR